MSTKLWQVFLWTLAPSCEILCPAGMLLLLFPADATPLPHDTATIFQELPRPQTALEAPYEAFFPTLDNNIYPVKCWMIIT